MITLTITEFEKIYVEIARLMAETENMELKTM